MIFDVGFFFSISVAPEINQVIPILWKRPDTDDTNTNALEIIEGMYVCIRE